MDRQQLVTALGGQAMLLAAAADRAGLDADVPSCPGWTVRDLVRHVGMAHRWATAVVEAAGPAVDDMAFEAATVYPPDDELDAWFRLGNRTLVQTLRVAADDHDCWAFMGGSPTPLHFWTRRQLHETAVHRMDAELAAGLTLSPMPPELAADGVDELLASFLPRGRRLRSDEPWTMSVVADDVDEAWTVRVTAEPTVTVRGSNPADVGLTGSAGALYASLWNRSADGVTITGDGARVAEWQAKVRVGW